MRLRVGVVGGDFHWLRVAIPGVAGVPRRGRRRRGVRGGVRGRQKRRGAVRFLFDLRGVVAVQVECFVR